MRFGIVGAGVIGAVHAELISSMAGEAELAVIADIEQDRAAQLAGEHHCAAASTVEDVLARSDVDAVSVCVPSGLHAEIAVPALEAGRDVIIEKPIDVTLAAADRILEAQRRSGRTVTTISQRRFQPAFRAVQEAVTSGHLGRLAWGMAESTFWRSQEYYDSGGWRGTWALDGGGALMNQGIHALDLLVWMMGEPVEATATTATLAHDRIEVEDTLSATLRFAGGALGTVTATTAAYPGRSVRLTVAGDAGTAIVDSDHLTYLQTKSAESAADGDGDRPPVVDNDSRDGEGPHAAHRAQYADFLAAVREGRSPKITAADGRRALATVLAIYESARHGGRPAPVR